LIVNAKAGAPGMSRSGVNWVQAKLEHGAAPGVRFYKSFAKKIGGPEASEKPTFWLGTTIEKAADADAVTQAAQTLTSLTRRGYMQDVHKSSGATFCNKTIAPLDLDSEGANWLMPHADALHAAGVGVRPSLSTAQWIRNSLEFFRLGDPPGSGGPHTALGRMLPGRGAGELWLTWFGGMDETLAIAPHLQPCSDAWPESDKVPEAVRLGLWLQVPAEQVDRPVFDAWVEALIAAAGCDGPGTWPSFARPALDTLAVQCNSRLPDIIEALQDGAMQRDELRERLGGERASLSAINRLLYWRDRYHMMSPIRSGRDDTVELEPTLTLDLSTPAPACTGAAP
jgi:hypothetical protein